MLVACATFHDSMAPYVVVAKVSSVNHRSRAVLLFASVIGVVAPAPAHHVTTSRSGPAKPRRGVVVCVVRKRKIAIKTRWFGKTWRHRVVLERSRLAVS